MMLRLLAIIAIFLLGMSEADATSFLINTVSGPSTFAITNPTQTLTDASGNTWSLTSCQVHENGVAVTTFANVIKVVIRSGNIYYYNGTNWYQWTGSTWTGTSDPGTYDQVITGPGRPGAQISDTSGNIWTIEDCVPAENGSASWPQSILLMAINGTIYTQYDNGSWNHWNGSWQGDASSPLGQLGFGLTAIAGQAVFDTTGASWTISSGQVYRNGSLAGTTSNIAQLAYIGGSIYAEDTSSMWYAWSGSAWSSRIPNPFGQPSVGTLLVTAGDGTSSGQSFVDSGGNVWSVQSYQAYENGATAGSTSSVTRLAYAGVPTKQVYYESFPNWFVWSGSAWSATSTPFGSLVPVSGTCGSANGTVVSTAPSSNLCIAGDTVGSVTSSGPWYWSCTRDLTTQCSAAPSTGTGTPVAPAQAVSAGYSTVLLGQNFATDALSLDCAGQTQSAFWHQGMWWETPPPCSQIAIAPDSMFGQNVLDIKWLRSTTSTSNSMAITTMPYGLKNGDTIPPAFSFQYGYYEIVLRASTNVVGTWPAAWALGTGTAQRIVGQTAPTDVPEFDFAEFNGGNSATPSSANFGSSYFNSIDGLNTGVIDWLIGGKDGGYTIFRSYVSPYDWTLPHAYGWLWTPTQICSYIDNVQKGCQATSANPAMTNEPVYPILSFGVGCNYQYSDISCTDGRYGAVLNRADLLVSRLTIWQSGLASITHVQGAANNGLSATATYGIAPGNGVGGYIHYCTAAAGACPGTDVTGTITVTDDQGDSYTLGAATTDAAQGTTGRSFYTTNIHPATQLRTLTIGGLSNTSAEDAIEFEEFFGGVTLDAAISSNFQTAVGSGANAVTSGSGGGTTTAANDAIFAGTVNAGGAGNFAVGTGFTAGSGASPNGGPNIWTGGEYKLGVSSGASVTGTFTNNGAAGDFVTSAIAFKAGSQTVGPASVALAQSSVTTTSSSTSGTVLTSITANYPHMNDGSTFSGSLSASGNYNGSPLCAISGTNVTLAQNNPPAGSSSCTITATQNGVQAQVTLNVTITGTTISGVALSNGNNFSVPASSGSTLDAVSATCSSGSCVGATFALSTAGACSGASSNGSFAISGSNLNVGGSTISSPGSYPIGIAVTLAGASNSGACYPLTLTGQAQTIASIAPSSCSMIGGTTGVCTPLTVTMSPPSPTFAADGGALALVASGGSCSGIDANWATDFSLSGGNLSVVNASLAQGTYNACVQASASGITTIYQQVVVSITPVDPTVGLLATASDGYANWKEAGLNSIPITGSISGTTLTVTQSFSGALGVGQKIGGLGVTPGTTITAAHNDPSSNSLTGTGNNGTYTVNNSQTVSSEALTASGIPNRCASLAASCVSTTLTATGNASTDTSNLQTALNNCGSGQVVKMNTGVFMINGTGVNFGTSSCTLRGAGVGALVNTGINPTNVDDRAIATACTYQPNG